MPAVGLPTRFAWSRGVEGWTHGRPKVYAEMGVSPKVSVSTDLMQHRKHDEHMCKALQSTVGMAKDSRRCHALRKAWPSPGQRF
jgi:hypothetical protein